MAINGAYPYFVASYPDVHWSDALLLRAFVSTVVSILYLFPTWILNGGGGEDGDIADIAALSLTTTATPMIRISQR